VTLSLDLSSSQATVGFLADASRAATTRARLQNMGPAHLLNIAHCSLYCHAARETAKKGRDSTVRPAELSKNEPAAELGSFVKPRPVKQHLLATCYQTTPPPKTILFRECSNMLKHVWILSTVTAEASIFWGTDHWQCRKIGLLMAEVCKCWIELPHSFVNFWVNFFITCITVVCNFW
jgi:hypothetical protein